MYEHLEETYCNQSDLDRIKPHDIVQAWTIGVSATKETLLNDETHFRIPDTQPFLIVIT